MTKSAYDLVWMAAQRTPEHLALVDDRSDRALNYRDLLTEIDSLAAGLAERGVRPGDRFATALPNLFDHCLAILALHRLGAVPALLNFRLTADEICALLRQGEISGALVLPDPDLATRVQEALPATGLLLTAGDGVAGVESLSLCRGDAASAPPYPDPEAEAASVIFYTSGTSGLPKGVVVVHRAHEPRVAWLSTMMGFRSGTHIRALGVSPLSHAIGFHGIFLSTLAFNGTFYTLSAFDPEAALALVESHRLNYLFSLPTVFNALVHTPGYDAERLASVETVYWGGAPIAPALLERLAADMPKATFGHIYGTTETMCALCNNSPLGQPEVLWQAYGSRVRIADLDDFAKEVSAGEEGELLVDATQDPIFSGYLSRPEETADKIREGWYRTGDGAVQSEDGSIRLLGRVDDMLRSGGEYVQPEEVETLLRTHDSVNDVALVGIPDSHWGQIAVACVVPATDSLAAADLDHHCRESSLANFKRPRGYVFVDQLPLSAGNKLLRRELRRMATEAREGEGDLVFHKP